MGLKVASTSLHWSHPSFPQTPSSAQALASAVSSPCSKRRSFGAGDGALCCRYTDRSVFLGSQQSSKLYRARSCDSSRSRVLVLRRALTASLSSFSDEEFSKQIQELALRFQLADDDRSRTSSFESHNFERRCENADDAVENLRRFDAVMEASVFPERDEIIPANIERKANSVEIPLSLRIIKRKKQWQKGLRDAGESACCSVKKAFSSMVFIIQELHSYTLQMREVLFYEDLQGVLARVQDEMQASFVWLFQQVFSHTPTLMVSVMILLANYSVYSMGNHAAIAGMPSYVEEVSVVEDRSFTKQQFDSSIVRTLKLSSSSGKTTSIGGNNGGGGKYPPIASGADENSFDESDYQQTIVPDGASSIGNSLRTNGEESVSGQEEETLWNSFVEEAQSMQNVSRDEALDQGTLQKYLSPADTNIESDDIIETNELRARYFKTEMQYQTILALEPNNALFLTNFAQFLYLIIKDFDRAEEYFKRAIGVEPKDADALNKYATFKWKARDDLWAAEEAYVEASEIEPDNSHYHSSYALFLWTTGGEDTCYPLGSPEIMY